ncbi:MAG: carbohydrate kinase family protein [bacterium]|nr:carbohydrate kinase family protein [bacterium]
MNVSVVGELNVDIIMRGINGFPELDKEKLAEEGKITLGSSSAICAVGLSRLGVKVNFIGAVGDDILGEYIIRFLNNERINTLLVKRKAGSNTGFTVSLTYPENRALITYTGVMKDFTVNKEDIEFVISNSTHLHISSFFLQKKLQQDIKELFSKAKERGLTVSLDPGWDPEDKNWSKLKELFPLVDILFLNEIETQRVYSTLYREDTNIDKAIEKLSKEVKIVVVKLGEKGALAMADNNKYYMKGFKIDVIDTTGAGDAFNAGFLYGRLSNYSVDKCLLIGNACGALSCTGIGGTTNLPTFKGLEEFIRKSLSKE